MQRVLVWDLPLRLFHWLFAVSVAAAFVLATTLDNDGPLFPIHSMLGLTAAFLIVLRVLWGLIGTRHARFSSFPFAPASLLRYLKGAIGGGDDVRHTSHNPATSWFAVLIFLVLAGLAITGLLLGRGVEAVKEIHEVFAWTAAALMASHLAGIVWHSVRYRENLAASMITGRKVGDPAQTIASQRFGSAIVLLALTAAWSALLIQGYDSTKRVIRIPLTGVSLTIGEAEGAGADKAARSREEDD